MTTVVLTVIVKALQKFLGNSQNINKNICNAHGKCTHVLFITLFIQTFTLSRFSHNGKIQATDSTKQLNKYSTWNSISLTLKQRTKTFKKYWPVTENSAVHSGRRNSSNQPTHTATVAGPDSISVQCDITSKKYFQKMGLLGEIYSKFQMGKDDSFEFQLPPTKY